MSEDRILMPERLTSEEGHKGLMIGEFKIPYKAQCPECDGSGSYFDDPCFECSGDGEIFESVDVPWSMIKEIYAKIVSFEKSKGEKRE